MSQHVPKLLFVGAGNIAQSIIKGIIKAQPNAAKQIMATAPTTRNLEVVRTNLGCQTTLLSDVDASLDNFVPDYVFICVKPQVLLSSLPQDMLYRLIDSISKRSRCTTLSLLAGVTRMKFASTFGIPGDNLVRVMLNTAAEIGSTSVFYHTDQDTRTEKVQQMENLFQLVGQPVIRLHDEKLMDVATGVCGSGIAFFYEMIQAISDTAVKNGLNRADATMVAAQLSKSAGEMILQKRSHPYQLRDEVSSAAGTTIHGLYSWHEQSTGHKIGLAVQSSIDRAKCLSESIK